MIAPPTAVLEAAIRSYVAAGSGLDRSAVIGGHESGPSPKPPAAYASVLLIADTADGFPWTLDSGAVLESVSVSYSVQFFRAGAHDLARRFRVWAPSPNGIAAAERRGLTFYRTNGVRQLDDVVADRWEPRAGLDLELGIVTVLTDPPDYADSFAAELCVDGQAEIAVPLVARPAP